MLSHLERGRDFEEQSVVARVRPGQPLCSQRCVLVGVANWGIGCAETSYPGVYTRLDEFTSWNTNIVLQ